MSVLEVLLEDFRERFCPLNVGVAERHFNLGFNGFVLRVTVLVDGSKILFRVSRQVNVNQNTFRGSCIAI